MSVESELVSFLDDNIRRGKAASPRNTDMVAYFYGFRGDPWPTLEDVAGRFGFSNRERPRQIIQGFKDAVQAEDIPDLRRLTDVISQRQYWFHSDLLTTVCRSQLAGDEFSIHGLFNLMEDVGVPNPYGIYTFVSGRPGLHRETRKTMVQTGERFVMQPVDVDRVNPLFRRARTLPGQYGIANLAYLDDPSDQDTLATYWPLLVDLIRQSSFAWLHETTDAIWYNFEDRDNVLVHYGEKVFSVIGECQIRRLAEAFHNALHYRSQKHPYPSVDLIHRYLSNSKYFEVDEEDIRFIGLGNNDLNDIERDVVDFLRDKDRVTFPDFRSHLSSRGYGSALVTKSINTSPFVHVDRSQGRGRHEYSLVATPGSSQDRYHEFLRELAALEQTDESVEAKQRREQPILRRWLFEGKTTERCAICGEEHMVSALRAAHKKKRSQCIESERRDPYVVMPVCIFGCDFLYEARHIVVEDGVVQAGSTGDFGEADLRYLQKVMGRTLDSAWLRGPSTYFDHQQTDMGGSLLEVPQR